MANAIDSLRNNLAGVAETIAEYARQIRSGDYPTRYVIWQETPDMDGDTIVGEIWSTKESDAIESWENAGNTFTDDHYVTEDETDDEPTVRDDRGNGTPISEWPLDIVDERGREFAVLITYGGPNIWLTADGLSDARLVGYWGGETVTLWDDSVGSFTAVLDYFIER